MTANLENRIKRLEAASEPTKPSVLPIIILRPLLADGQLYEPISSASFDDEVFTREPDESEHDFIDRVARADGWPDHVPRLICAP